MLIIPTLVDNFDNIVTVRCYSQYHNIITADFEKANLLEKDKSKYLI